MGYNAEGGSRALTLRILNLKLRSIYCFAALFFGGFIGKFILPIKRSGLVFFGAVCYTVRK